MSRPTPIGGRNRPMPTAAVSTVAKWTGWMPICLAIGNTTGMSTTAAGSPSSTMPKSMTRTDTARREQPRRGVERPQRLAEQRRHAQHAHQELIDAGHGEKKDHGCGEER